jgi:hypothetical protein
MSTGLTKVPPGGYITCSVANIGKQFSLKGVLRIVRINGTQLVSDSELDVAPGHGAALAANVEVDTILRCEWTLVGFAANVRATAEVFEGLVSSSSIPLVAIEGR